MMHNENDRPVKKTRLLAFIPEKHIEVFIPTIPNSGSKGVCLFMCACVHVCVRESERRDKCLCVCVGVCVCVDGKRLFGV